MSEKPIEMLVRAADEVLGTMFYVFASPASEPPDACPGDTGRPAICCHLEFTGPATGRIELIIGPRLAQTLTANFLGEEPEAVTDAMIMDAAKELTNMIGGRFLVLYEPKRSVKLGLPQIGTCPLSRSSEFFHRPDEALCMEAEEGLIGFRLTLEAPR